MASNPFVAPASPIPSRGSGYSYQPDGRGGVNYFYQGKPITNTVYQAANPDKDTNSIEQYAKELYTYNTTGKGSPANPFGATTNTLASVPATPNTPSLTPGITNITPAPGSASPTGLPTNYFLHGQDVNGQTYDLSTPEGQESFRQAQLGNLGGARTNSINRINQDTQLNLKNAQTQNAAALAGYNQNATDFGRSLANNVVNLGQNYDLGQVNAQQEFAGMSPNAFQSGQATSQQYNTDQYNKGLTQLQQSEAENVGGNYLKSGQIDPNSAIGREIGLENNGYNSFTTQANNTLNRGIEDANIAYQTGVSGVNNNLLNLNAYAGRTAPTTIQGVGYNYSSPTTPTYNPYQSPSGNPYTSPNVDISQYTPYVNSSQLDKSPQAQAPSPATWTGSGNPFSGLLGYNPNNTQNNYLNAFLGRSGTPATAPAS